MTSQAEPGPGDGPRTVEHDAGDKQRRMLRAVHACLRPLARILLRSGLTYQQFAAVAKRAFVLEALAPAQERGERLNVSRAAVRTGLSRKEVARTLADLESLGPDSWQEDTDKSGPLSKILHEWHTNPAYLDAQGRPLRLPFESPGASFSQLVRSVCGDVPPGAVRAELLRSGAVQRLDDADLQATKRFYVPQDVDEKALTTLSRMLYPLAAGIAHNSDPHRTSEGYIQRIMYADGLDATALPMFRKMVRQRASDFLEAMDDWLGATGVTSNTGEGTQVGDFNVGVGVFYFEGPSAEEITETTATPRDAAQ